MSPLSLTSDELIYDPYNVTFAQQDEALTKYLSGIGDRIGAPPPSRRLCAVHSRMSIIPFDHPAALSLQQTTPTFDTFSRTITSRISTLRLVPSGKLFESQMLAHNWGTINLQTAKRTVGVATQQGVKTVLHPTLSRCFRTNDRQLLYRRLPIDSFTDTLTSNTKISCRNKKYHAQIFAMSDGWCCAAFPMSSKKTVRGFSICIIQVDQMGHLLGHVGRLPRWCDGAR